MESANFARIEPDLCKGCRLCVETCPRDCLEMGTDINKLGYQYARFARYTCTACGMCFYACPEPGAITVYKDEPVPAEARLGAAETEAETDARAEASASRGGAS